MVWNISMHSRYFFLVALLSFSCSEQNTKEPKNLSNFSEAYLRSIQQNENTSFFQDSLKHCSMNSLIELTSDKDAHLSFWLNIYNSSVQVQLQKGLDNYADKDRFFNSCWIKIAGETFSLNDIELGIVGRKSTGKKSVIQKIRSTSFNPKVHFALNCGANSCPPIRIYYPKTVQQELEQATRAFLKSNSSFSVLTNTLTVDELFIWYAEDFNGTIGIIDLHKKYGIVPLAAAPKLSYSSYDWTIHPKAFVDESKK
jgi:hypothetical protein